MPRQDPIVRDEKNPRSSLLTIRAHGLFPPADFSADFTDHDLQNETADFADYADFQAVRKKDGHWSAVLK